MHPVSRENYPQQEPVDRAWINCRRKWRENLLRFFESSQFGGYATPLSASESQLDAALRESIRPVRPSAIFGAGITAMEIPGDDTQ